jgi:hypothetical protein
MLGEGAPDDAPYAKPGSLRVPRKTKFEHGLVMPCCIINRNINTT